jgi:hypothetical protein
MNNTTTQEKDIIDELRELWLEEKEKNTPSFKEVAARNGKICWTNFHWDINIESAITVDDWKEITHLFK